MKKSVRNCQASAAEPFKSTLTPPKLASSASDERADAVYRSTSEDLHVEYWPVERLVPNARNARTHSEAQVAQIAGSIREFGWTNPVLVDGDGRVIAGHARILAARQLGLARVPVIEIEHLTEAQKRAYMLADNQLALNAGWDMNLLRIELTELQELGTDLNLVGFSPGELGMFMADSSVPPMVEDEIPAPPDEAITQKGDLWILGRHRLLCGDSGLAPDVDRLLGGQQIHLVNTDPPYNVNVEPRSNNAIAAGLTSFSRREDLQCERSQSERGKKDRARLARKSAESHHQGFDLARHPEKSKPIGKMRAKDRPLVNDFVSPEAFEQLLNAWFGTIARVLPGGGVFYIWGGYANCANYPPVLQRHGLYFSQALIWVKEHPVLTRKDFMGNHEWCFYGWKEGAGHRFYGPSNVYDTWSVKKVNPNAMVHLTEKPVELAARALSYSSLAGQNVFDLFGGSGSTMMAAEQCDRSAFLMELDPLYCDVIVQRWEKFTGKKADRIPQPTSGNSVAAEKAPPAVQAEAVMGEGGGT